MEVLGAALSESRETFVPELGIPARFKGLRAQITAVLCRKDEAMN